MTTAERLRLGVGGIVPVRWEAEKADDGPGTLTGWASVYNVVDQQDDVVRPGAFSKTIAEWTAAAGKRVITLTADHDNTVGGVIGSVSKMVDSPYGLKTTFTFASTQDAQDARTKAKEGHLNGLSILGPIFSKEFTTVDGREIRVLKEVGLLSVGLTSMPANTSALVLAAKGPGIVDLPDELLPEDWVADLRAALAIGSPQVRKTAVEALIASRYTLTPTGAPADAPAGPSDPAPAVDDHGAAARYALSVIGESGPSPSPGGEPKDSLAELLAAQAADTSSDLDRMLAEIGRASGGTT